MITTLPGEDNTSVALTELTGDVRVNFFGKEREPLSSPRVVDPKASDIAVLITAESNVISLALEQSGLYRPDDPGAANPEIDQYHVTIEARLDWQDVALLRDYFTFLLTLKPVPGEDG